MIGDAYILEKITTKSTSLQTAKVNEITLSESDNVKLSFEPNLIDNTQRPEDSISGKIVYQKKHKTDQFVSYDRLSRTNMKVSDWMEISLSTSEVTALYKGLKYLYELFKTYGIQYGEQSYIPIGSDQMRVLEMLSGDDELLTQILESDDYGLFKKVIKLLTAKQYTDKLTTFLSLIELNGVENLNLAVNIESLKRTSSLMTESLDNGKEEFWQTLFENNPWILTQIFHTSVSILESKAFVGGKKIDDSGGNLADFLFKNDLTDNITIIEIKTPKTKIIGAQYRNTYSLDNELIGAVNQVIHYRDSFLKNFYALKESYSSDVELVNPNCIVVIGNTSELGKSQLKALENFRNELKNVQIITYDEIICKTNNLIRLLTN